jgi:excinuclease ABC subunit C
MKSQDLKKNIKNLPNSPGVYLFIKKSKKISNLGEIPPSERQDSNLAVGPPSNYLQQKTSARQREILYIGKATSLSDRARSYFVKDIAFARSLLIENMVNEADKIEWIETDSVLEALILESNLIKKHKPKYNTKEKDDKSFNFLVITDEEYPRVFVIRARELQNKFQIPDSKFQAIYGPYTEGGSLKEALKIVRKIFPFRSEKDHILSRFNLDRMGNRKVSKSTLNEEIGLSPRFSIGVDNPLSQGSGVTKKEYAKTIKNIKLFFEGKSSRVLKNLSKEMEGASKEREFEKAEVIKRKIFALTHINDFALIKEQKISSQNFRIEAYDVAHISGSERVGVMVVVENGLAKKSDYRKFVLKNPEGGDVGALSEVLDRRLNHPEWLLPKLIVVDGGKAQKNMAERVLTKFGYQIPVVAVVKGLGHKPKDILGKGEIVSKKESDILLANSESHRFALKYHRERRSKNIRK